jgi:energy-coupling factor transporter ATP-binding protein EcfA2
MNDELIEPQMPRMQLQQFDYIERTGEDKQWEIQGFSLDNVNLIVGKNATGKSRILSKVHLLAGLLANKITPGGIFGGGKITAHFSGTSTVYTIQIADQEVICEQLVIDGKVLLDRDSQGVGQIWAVELNESIKFQTPQDQLAAVSRRDSVQHPYFEPLHNWAASLSYYQFGTDFGRHTLAAFLDSKTHEKRFPNPINARANVISVFQRGTSKLGAKFTNAVKDDMSCIGYHLDDIGVKLPEQAERMTIETWQSSEKLDANNFFPTPVSSLRCLYVKEADLLQVTEQINMSQGMFRALSLIIQLNFYMLTNLPSCILIDDIGEGLDFDRATKLIKILIDKAEKSYVQLIMTTNDRFIMNGVPLRYWSLIRREPGVSKLYNIRNHRDTFEEYELTGLNNFDFFASEFYLVETDQ